MPRSSRNRILSSNHYYHIFNRGFDRKTIFKDKQDYLRFLHKLEQTRNIFDWIIYSYCLMPNHYHLHIQIKHDPLPKIISSLQTSHSVYFNRRHKHFGAVFTNRYKSLLIQKDPYHLQLNKYIHLNPVKAKIVTKPQDYPFSSHGEIIAQPKHEYKIIDRRSIKSLFDPTNQTSLNHYRQFIEKEVALNYSPLFEKRGIIGSKRFQSQFE